MQVKLLVEGGEMKPGPALSQKIGPLGMNMNEIISKVNEATQDFKGLKVPVELEIDANTKEFDVNVFSPPVSELIKKEMGLEKGSGEQRVTLSGNLPIERAISIAKTKMPNLLCKDLKAAVKEVIGTCGSLGVLVESRFPALAEKAVDRGRFDKEINQEKTEVSDEKKERLAKRLKEIQAKQTALAEEEEEEEGGESSGESGESSGESQGAESGGESGEESQSSEDKSGGSE